jgi:hypothetical protein
MDPSQYRRVFALAGDPSDKRVLDKAGLEKAARIIILASKVKGAGQSVDNQTLMVTIAAAVRPRTRTIPTAVEIVDEGNLHYDRILQDVEYINGKDCCERLTSQAVLNPGVTEIYGRLLNFSLQTNEIYITKIPKELIGKSFKHAQIHFLDYDDEEIVPIGIERSSKKGSNTKPIFIPGITQNLGTEEIVLRQDDQLVVMAYDRPSYALIDEKGRWNPTYLARV